MKTGKFRVWDTINKKMIYYPQNNGKYILRDMGGNIAIQTDSGLEVDFVGHLIPMDSTGLHDKNVKEIYEGDIVKFQWEDLHVIIWSDDMCCWMYESPKWSKNQHGYQLTADVALDATIIGNIHENIELLGE